MKKIQSTLDKNARRFLTCLFLVSARNILSQSKHRDILSFLLRVPLAQDNDKTPIHAKRAWREKNDNIDATCQLLQVWRRFESRPQKNILLELSAVWLNRLRSPISIEDSNP